MKRQRRSPLPPEAARPHVEKNEATGAVADSAVPDDKQYAKLPLPHERDERSEQPARPRAVTRQAATDVASDQRDTDQYTRVGEDFDRKSRFT